LVQNGVNDVDGLRDLTGITVSPDNRHVYAVNIWHTMAVFDRDPGTSELAFAQVLQDGVDAGNNGLLGAQVVAVSPDGQHVYVTARRGDTITVFGRDSETGMLTFADQLRGKVGDTTANLDGAHGLAISPDGQHIYVASDNADMLLSLRRDSQAGTLAFIEELADNVDGVDGIENGWSVAVSPDGLSVYVAGFDDDSLAVFARDPSSGALTFTEVIRNKADR
jgi:DNA-binding beta-propeller fold protein YncE